MALSKRLRFEILRRDGFRCRYCGLTAAEAELRVDHVIPKALGGGDQPENLVTACEPCNTGKTSVQIDGPVVADVAADALRWAAAMAFVAESRQIERERAEALRTSFLRWWNNWTMTNWRGETITPDLPPDFMRSVNQFIAAGLTDRDLHELIEVTMTANTADEWRYFCGCCWRRVKENQERARAIVASDCEGTSG